MKSIIVISLLVLNAFISLGQKADTIVINNCAIMVPTTITVETDGFYITSTCEISNSSISIYDRWGNELYKSASLQRIGSNGNGAWFKYDTKWNYMKLQDGIYVWVLNCEFDKGEPGKRMEGKITYVK